MLSPGTYAFLEYRNPRDQEIVRKMYAGRPTLGSDGPGSWGTSLFTDLAHVQIYNSARDKDLFTDPRSGKLYAPKIVLGAEPASIEDTIAEMRKRGCWPVFEGKHIGQFVVGTKLVRWWLSVEQAEKKYGKPPRSEPTLVFRETARNTDERTCIAAVLPPQSAASHKLTGVMVQRVDANAAMTVLNSLCFDFALRLRTAGTNVSFTYMMPVAVPSADVVNRLPKIDTRLAWQGGIQHITEDRSLWPVLWEANKAVAEAYGLDAIDLAHILDTFPLLARKRLEFHVFLRTRLAEMGVS